ncbi:MAG: hypothetical protein ACRCS9_15205 [Hyphomicrobium sp.]
MARLPARAFRFVLAAALGVMAFAGTDAVRAEPATDTAAAASDAAGKTGPGEGETFPEVKPIAAPRPTQIEPMVAPVKREAPRAPDLKKSAAGKEKGKDKEKDKDASKDAAAPKDGKAGKDAAAKDAKSSKVGKDEKSGKDDKGSTDAKDDKSSAKSKPGAAATACRDGLVPTDTAARCEHAA